MLPFLLNPAFKDYLWGGTRLKNNFNKDCAFDIVAESWELSAHPDGDCVIASGPFAGMLFSEFVTAYPEALGNRCTSCAEFPILVKLIDAAQSLSIQVHPQDDYARRVEHSAGKTEMWHILDCEPGATLYFGFQQAVTPDAYRASIADGTVTGLLQAVPVHPGDTFFIEAGTVHAIGAGILLAEIQQNSNATYRVYDFGRVGADGKPRDLHIDKAVDVSRLEPANTQAPGAGAAQPCSGGSIQRLASCDMFTTDRLCLDGCYTGTAGTESFLSLLCLEGNALLRCDGQEQSLSKGDCVFIPAGSSAFALDGTGVWLLTCR